MRPVEGPAGHLGAVHETVSLSANVEQNDHISRVGLDDTVDFFTAGQNHINKASVLCGVFDALTDIYIMTP